jgi:hypothetical protein
MRGAICAIFIVILSKNYNSNALSHAWFRGKHPLPSFASGLFDAYHAIWRRPGQIAVAADDKTDLYFGIAARRHSADVSLGAPNAAFGGKADMPPCPWIVSFLRTIVSDERVFNIEHSL